MCIFEGDTVKSDCPVQIFRKMMKYLKISYRLLVYLTSFTVFSGDIKKWSFSELFLLFFRPPTINMKNISRKSTNNNLA